MAAELSATYQEAHVPLATGKLHLLRQGEGPPLLFLHHSIGSPGWLPVHAALAERFEVIVPDLPGYAGSERPAWAREPRDLALILNHLSDALGLTNVTLVGTGFGGYVAAEMAVANASRLARLVLIGAAGLQPRNGEILDQMMMSHSAYAQAGFRDDAHFAAIFGAEQSNDVKQLWDFSREMSARVTWKPYMFNRRLAPLLGNLKLPTLVLWGGADQVVPLDCGNQYRDAITGARLDVIADAGHCVEMEEPALVAERIAAFAGR